LIAELPTSIERVERQSKFVVAEFEGNDVTGYLNSDLKLEVVARYGNLIGTLLHGPILAKNSWLADALIQAAMHGEQRDEINAGKFDEIEKLAVAARELAQEQAKD
jgi:CobQ-like glutamine amidotransferase family enzyme